MDIFGIGFLELFFIVLIALIVLGPKDMVKAGRAMGKFLRKILLMPGFMDAQRWVRNFPAQLVREAGIDEIQRDLKKETDKIREATTVSLDGNQPAVTGSAAKPPALAPNQQTSTLTDQAGLEFEEEWDEADEPVLLPPHIAAAQANLPSEWLNAPARPVAPIKKDNLDEFPTEWISPPTRSGPTHPPPFTPEAPVDSTTPPQTEAQQD